MSKKIKRTLLVIMDNDTPIEAISGNENTIFSKIQNHNLYDKLCEDICNNGYLDTYVPKNIKEFSEDSIKYDIVNKLYLMEISINI
jgi:hypothetical protein